ncbi:MAG: XkdX family protein [Parabacteroides sp.]|nr:XkdX family protein [Parabacteroides sp.]
MEHSSMYESLRNKYELNYITKATLKGRVRLYATKPAKGITPEEYEEITGEVYEED